MRSLMAWANEQCPVDPFSYGSTPFGIPANPTRLQVIAALTKMDRGGYGLISGGGIYGRQGLYQEEAYSFWALREFVNGWLAGTEDAEAGAFLVAIKEEWKRVESLREQPKPQDPSPI